MLDDGYAEILAFFEDIELPGSPAQPTAAIVIE